MQVTLFISSLIAILAIAVYFVHRAYLDRKIFEDARESMDLIVEHLDGMEMAIVLQYYILCHHTPYIRFSSVIPAAFGRRRLPREKNQTQGTKNQSNQQPPNNRQTTEPLTTQSTAEQPESPPKNNS